MKKSKQGDAPENERLLAGAAPEEVSERSATSFYPISTQQFFQQAKRDYDGAERTVTVYKHPIKYHLIPIPVCSEADDRSHDCGGIKFPFKRTGAWCLFLGLCSGGVIAFVGCVMEGAFSLAVFPELDYGISALMSGAGVLCCLIGRVGGIAVPIYCCSCDSVPSLEEAPEGKNVILIGPSRRITRLKYEGAALAL